MYLWYLAICQLVLFVIYHSIWVRMQHQRPQWISLFYFMAKVFQLYSSFFVLLFFEF